MNYLNSSRNYREKLRRKFFEWLTAQMRNTTTSTHPNQEHSIEKADSYVEKSYLRSINSDTITEQSKPINESLPSIDEYFNLNNTDKVHNYSSLNNNIDYYLDVNNNSSNINSTLFDFNWPMNSNYTFDQFTKSESTIDMMHATNSYDSTKMAVANTSRLFDLKNISITDLNITTDNLNDFLTKLIQLSQPINESGDDDDDLESSACRYYCNGFVKDLFGSYKSVHGYISLVVRGFDYYVK